MDDDKTANGARQELDRDHRHRTSRVAKNDTKAGQDEDGQFVEEAQKLAARRKGLGSDEHVEACRRCKRQPYAVHLWRGSRLARSRT